MGERKFKNKKTRVTVSVTPERRKLAIIVAVLTLFGIVLESDPLNVFSTDDSLNDVSQESDEFSDLESMLAEFSGDAATPDTQQPQADPSRETHAIAAVESSSLLIPSTETPTEVPDSNVSFSQSSEFRTAVDAPPSSLTGGREYGFSSAHTNRPASVTGVRFTGSIQPIQ
ncbi:MAG: hypothetical protein P8J37_10810 [Fuerstiella sp.]|nr:hypothetical protein [Fuerstiella sp.]